MSFPSQLTAGVSFHAKNGFSLMESVCCSAEKERKLIEVGWFERHQMKRLGFTLREETL